jgi:23S rRNA (uracil1939-C5)-methyltransferase
LRLKTALVDRLVRAAVPRAPRTLPMMASTPLDDPWGYRHKAHFVFGSVSSSVGRRSQRLVMGHYVRGSRRIIPVRECPVHDARGNAVAFHFSDVFAKAFAVSPLSRRDPEQDGNSLQGIAIRVGARTEEIAATLVVTRGTDKGLRSATRQVLGTGIAPTSLHVNVHPKRDGFLFGPETRRITGPERMRETVGDTSFLISPTAFFQTNVHAAEILVRLVVAEVPVGASVLDLYAGAGLFALPLARAGHRVTAVEESRAAVADGEASLRLNRIPPDRCRFIARPVEKWRPAGAFDFVILDPPREGCTPEVIEQVFGRLRPPTAVYISCNPEALARDLALIVAQGYGVRSMQPVDMFPHTAHVETVVTLTRQTFANAR